MVDGSETESTKREDKLVISMAETRMGRWMCSVKMTDIRHGIDRQARTKILWQYCNWYVHVL